MKIKYIRAQNFLSIGKDGVEIDFTEYGNIVNINGRNLDVGPKASNGAGKSTIIEIIVYALYGELMKNLNHEEAIHLKAGGKGLETEVHFEIDGHDYKMTRKQGSKHRLELFKDDVDISGSGVPATQKILDKIIKLSYTAFINVVCFGQHNTKQFLGCKPADKRAIAENLLSLDKYNEYCKRAKDKQKDLQERLKYLMIVYDKTVQEVSTSERQIKQLHKQQDDWRASQLNTIERLRGQIAKAFQEKAKLSDSSTADKHEKLQLIISQMEVEKEKKNQNHQKLNTTQEKINEVKDKLQSDLLKIKELQYRISKTAKEIEGIKLQSNNLLAQKGATCNVCYGTIDPKNFKHVIEHNKSHINELMEQLKIDEADVNDGLTKRKKYEEFLAKLKNVYEEFSAIEMGCNKALRELEQKKIVASSAYHDSAGSAVLMVDQQIKNYEDQIEHKQKELDGGSPFKEVLLTAESDLENSRSKVDGFKSEITNLESQVPYYEFWIKAFGDNGIRSFILNEVCPMLNLRINYWLQFLVDNMIRLNFNDKLEEKIERNPPDGDQFVYNAMSGGEHQRIDLGIALAFAQVMMLTAGTVPSLIFLDEVGTNLDRPGIQCVYNTICELSRERQVIVTTHDPDLQNMLAQYPTVVAVKEKGTTRLEKM
jgi:DNA repair exonuclease SbcCD ATPase subunit